jgi:hypothetical protein
LEVDELERIEANPELRNELYESAADHVVVARISAVSRWAASHQGNCCGE